MRSRATARKAGVVTFTITPPADFLNANDRLHWTKRSELTKKWRRAAESAIDDLPVPRAYERAHITVSIRFSDNRRRDVGNYYPTAKALVDGCVDAGLLADDSDQHVMGPDMRRVYPNGAPEVTVTIEETA